MRTKYIYIMLTILAMMLFLLNIFCGAVAIDPHDTLQILMGQTSAETNSYIIIGVRLPQACVAVLAGAALAISGLMLQTLFSNPLADASILGIHSGAGLGAAVVIMLTGGVMVSGLSGYVLLVLASLVGAVGVMAILMVFSSKVRSNAMLLIIGVMLSYMISSGISLLSYIATADNLQLFFMWGMGSFSSVSLSRLPVFAVIVMAGLLVALTQVKALNALLLGEHYAQNAGVSIRKARTIILLAVGLLSAVVVAFCGPVAFIGLAVPHISRMVFGTSNHLVLMPASFLIGAIMALICNFFTTFVDPAILIPVNVITPFIGVPVIFYILWRRPLYRQ